MACTQLLFRPLSDSTVEDFVKFKVAVAGTGFIGPVHVEGLRRAGVEVVGILGSTPDKSQSSATEMHIEKAYASFDELLADADVDCVYLPSPVDFKRFFEKSGYEVVRYSREGSSRFRRICATLAPSFTPTVYFVAEKKK